MQKHLGRHFSLKRRYLDGKSFTISPFHISFYTHWKRQKTRGFLIFSAGIERDQWHEIGWDKFYCCRLIFGGLLLIQPKNGFTLLLQLSFWFSITIWFIILWFNNMIQYKTVNKVDKVDKKRKRNNKQC